MRWLAAPTCARSGTASPTRTPSTWSCRVDQLRRGAFSTRPAAVQGFRHHRGRSAAAGLPSLSPKMRRVQQSEQAQLHRRPSPILHRCGVFRDQSAPEFAGRLHHQHCYRSSRSMAHGRAGEQWPGMKGALDQFTGSMPTPSGGLPCRKERRAPEERPGRGIVRLAFCVAGGATDAPAACRRRAVFACIVSEC
jgi:hypothetical protein